MKLLKYIKKYHNDNKAAFARAFDRQPQGVSRMFRKPEEWLVLVDGDRHTMVQVRAVMIHGEQKMKLTGESNV